MRRTNSTRMEEMKGERNGKRKTRSEKKVEKGRMNFKEEKEGKHTCDKKEETKEYKRMRILNLRKRRNE